ncbi:hypothetical protein PSTG_06893 [Puccinia striiformis f. sp. tritici PST-78]|uniref:Uncharacterized protein n=1 Tax=Puccinia striiformis f. sp. tritici PST-78 TaxID=1165861 RepID=A0A0L0VKJ4_9BASI|nr:hypothetical protein PSTG_06893 [Puccinia striiformis f. sp. tritici PST-78]
MGYNDMNAGSGEPLWKAISVGMQTDVAKELVHDEKFKKTKDGIALIPNLEPLKEYVEAALNLNPKAGWMATYAVFGGVRTRVNLTALRPAGPSHNKNQEPSTQTLHVQLSISIRISASDSALKQEISDPVPPLAPIKPLAPSEPHPGKDLAKVNHNDEVPGTDLAKEPPNNGDEVSLASLDDQVHTKTSEVESPPNQLTSTQPIELVTTVNDFDYQIGEPMDPPPHMRFLLMDNVVEFVRKWAKHNSYGLCEGSSHAGKNINMQCDQAQGEYCCLAPFYLGHVGGNHWVLAELQVVDGVTPIPPVVGSSRASSQIIKAWTLPAWINLPHGILINVRYTDQFLVDQKKKSKNPTKITDQYTAH